MTYKVFGGTLNPTLLLPTLRAMVFGMGTRVKCLNYIYFVTVLGQL